MNPLAMSELADEGVMLRLWTIMSVLVCVELPGARVLPGIVRSTCVHGCRGSGMPASRERGCVCVFPSLDCIVEKKVASQRPIAPSLTCLTGTGASGRLRTVQL